MQIDRANQAGPGGPAWLLCGRVLVDQRRVGADMADPLAEVFRSTWLPATDAAQTQSAVLPRPAAHGRHPGGAHGVHDEGAHGPSYWRLRQTWITPDPTSTPPRPRPGGRPGAVRPVFYGQHHGAVPLGCRLHQIEQLLHGGEALSAVVLDAGNVDERDWTRAVLRSLASTAE